jgi:hypothetical protein
MEEIVRRHMQLVSQSSARVRKSLHVEMRVASEY